jgi:hypothetical protein
VRKSDVYGLVLPSYWVSPKNEGRFIGF